MGRTRAVSPQMLELKRGGLLERTNRGLLHTIEFIKEALLVQWFTGELPNSQLFYLFYLFNRF